MFRIIVNIIGAFLIYAIYIVLAGLTQRLKKKFPYASASFETQIVEKMLLWSTIILMAFLLLSGIVVAFKALPQGHEISLKQVVVINISHFQSVAYLVFISSLLMMVLTGVEAIFIRFRILYQL